MNEKMMTYPEWQQKPALLTNQDMENPVNLLTAFFETYSLPAFREMHWEILSTAIGGNRVDFYDGREVGEWMFLHHRLQELLEACWMIEQKGKTVK